MGMMGNDSHIEACMLGAWAVFQHIYHVTVYSFISLYSEAAFLAFESSILYIATRSHLDQRLFAKHCMTKVGPLKKN